MKLLVSLKSITFLTLLPLLISCADKPRGEMKAIISEGPGLFIGLWQGFILPFSLLGKIINLNIGIHENIYSGATYWIGYLFGFILFMKIIVFFAVNDVKR